MQQRVEISPEIDSAPKIKSLVPPESVTLQFRKNTQPRPQAFLAPDEVITQVKEILLGLIQGLTYSEVMSEVDELLSSPSINPRHAEILRQRANLQGKSRDAYENLLHITYKTGITKIELLGHLHSEIGPRIMNQKRAEERARRQLITQR